MMRWVWLVNASLVLAAAAGSYAQRPQTAIGSIAAADATVMSAGELVPANGGRTLLTGNATVTANDHTAVLTLERGGEIRVCQTSALHVTENAEQSLQLGLDRGALEIHTTAKPGDVVVTPDLRFTVGEAAPLELAMRVSRNGDTCIDNRGRQAPTLKIVDAFGDATYELKPGQHVLFEHGSLREVVDKETVPCGCPPDERLADQSVSLAEAAIRSGAAAGKPATPEQAAAAHPFPAAVSEGLAPPAALPAEAPGQTHVLVATTLAYDPNVPAQSAPAPATPNSPQAPLPAAPKKAGGGPFAAVGRFFKRLFAR